MCFCVRVCVVVVVIAESREIKAMIRSHMHQLSTHKRYKDAWKVVIIESNMSYIGADDVAEICLEFPRVIIEERDPTPKQRVGIWTGQYTKEVYGTMLQAIIEKEDGLYFASDEDMIGNNVANDKKILIEQLRQYHKVTRAPSDLAFGKFKFTWTGKSAGGQKDDEVLALMIRQYWGRLKRETPQFQQFASQMGIRLS